MIAEYVNTHYPGYLFPAPLQSVDGKELVKTGPGYFRVFPYVKYSHTIDVVEKPAQAYEAASQFAKFTKVLSGIDTSKLKVTLPDFHNLALRYSQFKNALKDGNKERIARSKEMIAFLHGQKNIVDEYENIKLNPEFKTRVTHHDTKISNVLFDTNDKGLCVIDLDTVMPGYFISDVGDMMRTYLSPVSEEEKDFSKIEIREDFYKAIVNGYMKEMDTELTETEKKYFIYAGKFMIYMQALRFLTDFINNDIYYGSKYESHNFMRAGNQITLLNRLLEFETGNKE
jgi:Ser/Thr protein kinase RdoA (MazF antagonist)